MQLTNLKRARGTSNRQHTNRTARTIHRITNTIRTSIRIVNFTIRTQNISTHLTGPFRHLANAFVGDNPTNDRLVLVKNRVVRLHFALPLSDRCLISLEPTSDVILDSDSESLHKLGLALLLLSSVSHAREQSLAESYFFICLSTTFASGHALDGNTLPFSPATHRGFSQPTLIGHEICDNSTTRQSTTG